MKQGTDKKRIPTGVYLYPKKKDYDFHASFGTVGFNTQALPRTFDVDAGLTMRDQNADGFLYGCTGYAQTELCINEDSIIYDAGEFYLATPPGGGLSGRDIRKSLELLVSRGPRALDGSLGHNRTAFYNVRATNGFLDWFDAARVSMFITRAEKRALSAAMPWFPEFEGNKQNSDGSHTLVSLADGVPLQPALYTWNAIEGHNAVITGWTDTNTRNEPIRGGELFLKVKSHQGPHFGDNGWLYFDRATTNCCFSMRYTGMYTATKLQPGAIQTIDLDAVDRLVSFIRSLLGLH